MGALAHRCKVKTSEPSRELHLEAVRRTGCFQCPMQVLASEHHPHPSPPILGVQTHVVNFPPFQMLAAENIGDSICPHPYSMDLYHCGPRKFLDPDPDPDPDPDLYANELNLLILLSKVTVHMLSRTSFYAQSNLLLQRKWQG